MPKKPNAPAQRRRAFAEAIAKGMNGQDAARAAGWKGAASSLKVKASNALRHPEVQARLAELREATSSDAVATVKEMKEFWTSVMRGEVNSASPVTGIPIVPTIADRLKAAELLGKTEALFVDRKKHEGGLTVTIRRGSDAPSALPPKEEG
jgi:phage terminase small subunit